MSDVFFRMSEYHRQIIDELFCASRCEPAEKDIIIVVHNQLDYLVRCIHSIRSNTERYKIYVWDNNSDEDTARWLSSQTDIRCVRHHENIGFIKPNNALIRLGDSPYVICLNSDTEVVKGWDSAMISQIQKNGFSQVGYIGGRLNSKGRGYQFGFGENIDYIPGWCFCIPRLVYERHGLFDEDNLCFAYCEDSDFSMRLTESGCRIYALHLGLVIHHENKTIKEVMKTTDCNSTYERNHDFMARRWGHRIGGELS